MDYCTCGESFEIRKYVPLTLFFFQDCFGCSGSLELDRNFRMIFFFSVKETSLGF